MVHFWQFGFVLIFLCFDNGGSFQVDPLGSDQELIEEFRSLVGVPIFDYDELLLTSCIKQHPKNVSLNLSNLGIKSLPEDLVSSPHVTCLDLQGNKFENEVYFKIFQMQPNLEYLNLAKNKFNLQNLLNLTSHSRIKTLVLDNLGNYKLEEASTAIEYFAVYLGYRLHYIRNYYDLDVLHLKLPNLETLSLQNLNPYSNNRDVWSFDLTSTKLTHLFLSNNKFLELNDAIFKTFPATLTHLFAENCNLYSYSTSVNDSMSLISLSLDRNSFNCPNGGCLDFESHAELKYLSIADCDIRELSYNIFYSNSKLTYLDMSANKIQQLSEKVFLKMPALESLNLNNNQLSKIPSLQNLKNLKKLYVKGNKLTHVDKDSFSSLENLKILTLSGNSIGYIDSSTFDKLSSLIVLDLSKTKINSLEYYSSFNLEYLILSNNTISSIDDIKLRKICNNNYSGSNFGLRSVLPKKSCPEYKTLKYFILTGNSMKKIKLKCLKYLAEDSTILL